MTIYYVTVNADSDSLSGVAGDEVSFAFSTVANVIRLVSLASVECFDDRAGVPDAIGLNSSKAGSQAQSRFGNTSGPVTKAV